MPTHAEIAATLLKAAAKFFRDVASQNPEVGEQMLTNADTYDTVAELVSKDPTGGTDPDAKGID
ncbi:hypothetical protein [Shumkonia mesophila]|uniref:hypothetical protein n=1 Tax=Shumkonia mesophila TaxID=2838854 RepID=UPI0029344CBF|nr:hypothetical protein [Shumkonia mesophila]